MPRLRRPKCRFSFRKARVLRRKAGLSTTDASAALGYGGDYVASYEAQGGVEPRATDLFRMAVLYRCKVADFMVGR